MRMLIAIPCCGQYEIGRISLYCFDRLVSKDVDFLLIDNSISESPWPEWKKRYQMDRWIISQMGENIGLIKSCQQAYKQAEAGKYDILCLSHNDLWIYYSWWDIEIVKLFERIPQLGGIGLFGSKGCSKDGHRLDTFGSLIEMAGHGRKMTEWIEPSVCFDGAFMAFSMEMLRQVNGFDQRYKAHHIYDLDASLTSIKLGYKNIVMNLPCHHLSGLTANNDAKLTSGPDVHTANSLLWKEKWSSELGVMVDDDFNYRWKL